MITVLKFVNNDEVIADLQQIEEGYSILVNPCKIDATITTQGKVNASLTPIALFSKDRTILLNDSTVMYTSEPTTEINKAYQDRFNPSTIVAPPEKKIILS